jgi:hypothetical protein
MNDYSTYRRAKQGEQNKASKTRRERQWQDNAKANANIGAGGIFASLPMYLVARPTVIDCRSAPFRAQPYFYSLAQPSTVSPIKPPTENVLAQAAAVASFVCFCCGCAWRVCMHESELQALL